MSRMTSTRARIKLRRILQSTDSGIRPAMQDSVNILHKEIIMNLPRNSGNLEDLITTYVAKNGMRAEVGLRGKKAKREGFYLRFLEFGTKGGKPRARDGSVLSSGSEVFGTQADIPPMPARPVLQPAWDKEKPRIVGKINKVIEDAIASARKL